ncbi:MAG: hypothetical protein AB2815_11105 [Candidatus Sedimenticola endophacoides]
MMRRGLYLTRAACQGMLLWLLLAPIGGAAEVFDTGLLFRITLPGQSPAICSVPSMSNDERVPAPVLEVQDETALNRKPTQKHKDTI